MCVILSTVKEYETPIWETQKLKHSMSMFFENGSAPKVTRHFYTPFKCTPESSSYGKCYTGPDNLTTTEVSRKLSFEKRGK